MKQLLIIPKMDELKEYLSVAEEYKLGFEYNDFFLPDLMEELSEKLCVHDNYGVCLNYAHASLSDVALEVWAERLGKYVKHIHINDNDLVSDLHLAWGSGKINRQSFYQSYDKYMQGASVLIETSTMENVKKSLEMLKQEKFI